MRISSMFLLFLFVGFLSCKKEKDNYTIKIKPVINSVQPTSGVKGTEVIITGSNFTTDISKIVVKINGRSAQVVSATTLEIKFIVPPKAGTGNIMVFVNGESITGPLFNFIYTVSVTTFSGEGTAGFADGNPTSAMFNSPRGMAIDKLDNIYVADAGNHRIRLVATNGAVTTFAGNGLEGYANGNAMSAEFDTPYDVALDEINGNIYVADYLNHCIRRISLSGNVTNAAGIPGAPGYVDGPGLSARINFPTGVAVEGELVNIYIADGQNHCIRKLDHFDVLSTFAGSTVSGQSDGNGTAAKFNNPFDIAWDSSGFLYVTDPGNENIRKITPAGFVSTVAGNGAPGYIDGTGNNAQFNYPQGISSWYGNIILADQLNNRIRSINPLNIVSTIAGTGVAGFTDGTGSISQFEFPGGIVRDSKGDYFISDTGNNKIRKIVID